MKKMFLLAAGLALFAAPVSAVANPTCLEIGEIDNFKVLNDRTLIVEDNFHSKFKITLFGVCPNLTFKEGIAFRSVGGTQLSCITPGDSIYTRDIGVGGQQCPVKAIEPYTAAMQKTDADATAKPAQ